MGNYWNQKFSNLSFPLFNLNGKYFSLPLQRRFSEFPEWEGESEEAEKKDNIEMVECHNEPTTSKAKLSNVPTLSVSGPSPPHDEEFL